MTIRMSHAAKTALGMSLLVGALLVSCTESTTPDGGATSTGGGATSSSSTATTSSSTAATGGSGGSASVGGAGGTGGDVCPNILIGDGIPATCSAVGNGAQPLADTTICPADSAQFWPAKVYEIAVSAGDCLYMQADNVGSPMGADLFGAIVEPGGKSNLYDEEIACTVTNPEGYACPAGGATMEASGNAYVIVGTWEGLGCTATEATPFELVVAINGVDVDLSGGAVCAGDLLDIIP
jgi:hypothetical protein